MNDPKLNLKSFKPARPLVRLAGAALTAFAVGCPPAIAQEAESSEQDVIELSPFVVDASSETGYRATQTLAGTRISSNLKDIPAQVDVMTAEFLDDVGAVTVEEAMLYSLNAENTQEYANNVSGNQTDGVIGLNSGSRVRGLGNASRTRDYFATYFQTDRYNSGGVTFNSGPNAILFGLGSPAGIMNQDSQQAYFNDRTRLEFRVDSENSYRGNFLVNREIIDGKLAVAVAGLYEDQELWKKPSFDRKKRAYGTFVYKPFKKTTIRASYEAITRNANRPRNTAMRDGVTPYLEWREAKMQELGITDPLDPRLYWAPGDPRDDSTPFLIESGVNLLITGSYEPIPEEFLLGSFVGKFGRILDTNSVLPETYRTTDAVKARRPRDLPGVHPADNIPRSLDDSIFPYDINVGGATRVDQSGDIILASLEQEITDNFFIQLAYHRETFDRFYVDLIRGDAQELRIDVNRYLPQERDSTEEPVLNPNRGRYYVENWGKGEERKNDIEDYRATATYRLDFTDRDGWMKWLGSHNITALVDYSKREEGNQGGRTTLYYDENGQWPAGVPIFSRGTSSAHFRLTHRVYLDDPNDPNGSHFTHHPDKDATVLNSEPFAGYDSVHITTYPDPELGLSYWDGGKWQTNEVKGQAMAVQSAFWNNRIIATYGRRKDDFKTQEVSTTRAVDAPDPYDDRQIYYGLISPSLDDPDIDDSATNDQFGVVFHALPWLSVFYNESTNSSIGNPGLNVVDGKLLPPSSGEGTDYGIILDLFEGKFTMRVNRFENTQLRTRSQQFDGLKWSVKSIETKLMNWELNEGVDPPAGVPWDPPTTWDPYFSNEDTQRANVLSDLESTGTEITLTYNPTRNWRIRLSAAKTESVETNIGANWQEYVAERQPYWENFYDRAWDGGNVAEPGEPTFGEEVETSVYAEYIDLIAVADGRASDRLSKYRVNLTTSYNFKEGRLKGWTVGGSYRFRSKRSIGYPLIDVNGTDVFDIENPYFGKGEKNIDAFITYNTKLKFLGKNVRARFQLNIRNVFDDRELLPQRAYTNGEISQYRVQAPRTFILSTRFEF
jgi:hypothetical protein